MCKYVMVIADGETADPVADTETHAPRRIHNGRLRAAFETALIAAGLAVLFFCMPHQIRGDDLVRFRDIQELLKYGKLTNSGYSLVMPLISVPVLLLGNVFAQLTFSGEQAAIYDFERVLLLTI